MPTEFQLQVWKKINEIPAGRVATYKSIAESLGSKAYRAVGSAVRKNPNAPETPCHRVVNSDGRVGAYSMFGGVESKVSFLKAEGINITTQEGVSYIADFPEVLWQE